MKFLWNQWAVVLVYILPVCLCDVTTHDGRYTDRVHNSVFDMKAMLDHVKSQKPIMEQAMEDLLLDNDASAALQNLGKYKELPAQVKQRRLRALAKSHDLNKDGSIDENELKEWIMQSFHVVEREEANMKLHENDVNADGKLSWVEILNRQHGYMDGDTSYLQPVDPDTDEHDKWMDISNDKRRFETADLNNDGILEEEEFMAYFLPHSFPHMFDLEVERSMNKFDQNGDESVSMDEFIGGHDDEEEGVKDAVSEFEDLDKNNDWKLSSEELKPWTLGQKDKAAKEEVGQLKTQCDKDKDGKLSIEEIVDNDEEFMSSSATDYGHIVHFIRDEL